VIELGHWILNDKCEHVEVDLETWARWFGQDNNRRKIESTMIGEALISTVFIGIDHNYLGKGPPILYETMVFGGPLDGNMDRYFSREQAIRGHKAMVEQVKAKEIK